MTDESMTRNQSIMMDDCVRMLEALHQIAMESQEAEMVRVAVMALTSTHAGRAHLQTNPIIL